MKTWGWHLLLDCKGGNKQKIKDRLNLEMFIATLCDQIGVKAFGPPILEDFAHHNPNLGGYSLMQLIETSTITGHFIDSNGDFYIDVFSCKEYNPQIAIDVVKDFFDPASIKQKFIKRKA